MLSDGLNELSKQQFEEVMNLFKRSAKLDKTNENNIKKKNYPNRDIVINSDDITNLKILLETCNNIDEFVKKV